MRKTGKASFVLLFLALFLSGEAFATHIRAGEITAVRVDCDRLEYEFTLTGYTDTESTVQFGEGEITFGDGTILRLESTRFDVKERLNDAVEITEFKFRHVYSAPGVYTIAFREFNRNADVCNMINSVNTPFYIETQIRILGCNSTPILLNPPVEIGVTGVRFTHNPGAFDPDGDSISFELTIPKKNVGVSVDGYQDPDFHNDSLSGPFFTEDGQNPAFFTLDQETGTLIWDAPGIPCEYNVAFKVCEWRKINGQYIDLSCITRDMQIIVEASDNERPEIELPNDTCIIAGTLLEALITATDPDGDSVILETFGGVYELGSQSATYSPNPTSYEFPEAGINFSWQTTCDQIRQQPYRATFKATDDGRPRLSTNETWNITVVGPPPENLQLTPIPSSRTIQVDWDTYSCQNADSIQIWRRIDSFDFTPGTCDTGIPEGGGYELIASVPASNNRFFDNNNGVGIAPGANYCYRLVATFPQPNGGESLPSEEICTILQDDPALITNVTVLETDEEEGSIEIRWLPPFYLDTTLFKPPFQYDIFRLTLSGAMEKLNTDFITDTFYVDQNIDTRNQPYSYKIITYDEENTLIDTSAVAQSVLLDPESMFGAIELIWEAETPWANNSPEFPWHYIYRDHVNPSNDDQLVLIDSVNVVNGNFSYLDDGLSEGTPLSEEIIYCYYVTTQGTYGNDSIPEPLINDSQIACAQPNDTVPPCTPVVSAVLENCEEWLEGRDCLFDVYQNTLSWTDDRDSACQDDIRLYRVYFSETGTDYELLIETRDTVFIHQDLPSFRGCYQVAAIDRSGNESTRSEPVCNDNCPYYELPNLFTPNNDGRNDVFRPYYNYSEVFMDNTQLFDLGRCPRFVQAVDVKIYNRWGDLVYTYSSRENREDGIYINWDGRSNDGTFLETGYYFYAADVEFDMLDPERRFQVVKGWVHLLK